MGLLQKIFTKKQLTKSVAGATFRTVTAYEPRFYSFSGGIYESELVRAAIDAIARNAAKLTPTITGSAKPSLTAKLKHAPNEWQTWAQFIYRLTTILYCENTAFVVPVFDKYGEITGVFPVLSSDAELIETKDGTVFMRYRFSNGEHAAIELYYVGILTRHQYKDDFFGANNRALLPTMDLITMQNQGIVEGVKNSATYRFMATLDNFANDEDLKAERKKFTADNLSAGDGGLLLFPNTYKDIKQIESKPFVIDADEQKLIQTNVYNYFGVNEDVLQNKAFGDAWSAFYEGAIEPLSIQMSEVLTKMIYTLNERSRGASIVFTANRLQYMSNADKMNVSAQMADRGLMTRNEIREIWNLPPLPADIGDTLPVRGEYYNLADDKNGGTNGE